MTDVLRVDAAHPDGAAIHRAADVLRRGGLVAFPTETVYGLGAHALDPSAVARVFEAKGRPSIDPLIVHIDSAASLPPLVADTPEIVRALAARFWPGPLTLVLRKAAVVPDAVTAGLDTVAIRVPAHAVARALLIDAGIPIAAPSANLFSRPSPTLASHVLEDLDGRVDLILDAGPTTVGVESTVLDVTATPPTVLRPGAVTVEMLRQVAPDVQVRHGAVEGSRPQPSPGLLDRHYSPRAPLTLYAGREPHIIQRLAADARAAIADGQIVGILAASEDLALIPRLGLIKEVGSLHNLSRVAQHLYEAMRDLDAQHVDRILARDFPVDDGLGAAIHDRLRRAAAGHVIWCGDT